MILGIISTSVSSSGCTSEWILFKSRPSRFCCNTQQPTPNIIATICHVSLCIYILYREIPIHYTSGCRRFDGDRVFERERLRWLSLMSAPWTAADDEDNDDVDRDRSTVGWSWWFVDDILGFLFRAELTGVNMFPVDRPERVLSDAYLSIIKTNKMFNRFSGISLAVRMIRRTMSVPIITIYIGINVLNGNCKKPFGICVFNVVFRILRKQFRYSYIK